MIGNDGRVYRARSRPEMTDEFREAISKLRYELAAGPKGLDGRIAPVEDEDGTIQGS